MKTIQIVYELKNWEYEILQEFGYDFIKNAQNQAKQVAIALAYNQKDNNDKEE